MKDTVLIEYENIPNIYATEGTADPVVYLKFFNDRDKMFVLVTECDHGDLDTLFGYSVGRRVDGEIGYFSLSGLNRLGYKADEDWRPIKLSEAKKKVKQFDSVDDHVVMLREDACYGDRDFGNMKKETYLVKSKRIGMHDDMIRFTIPQDIEIMDDRIGGRVHSVLMSKKSAKLAFEEAGYMPDQINDLFYMAEGSGYRASVKLDRPTEIEVSVYVGKQNSEKKFVSIGEFI